MFQGEGTAMNAKKCLKYVVKLTQEERAYLLELVTKGTAAARTILHAQVLLKADVGKDGPHYTDKQIINSFPIGLTTVSEIRQRFVEESLESALNRKKHSRTKPRKFDGEKEAKLVALCCSETPEGCARWTLKLLADEVVRMNIVEHTSPETIRQTLKKMNLSPGQKKSGAFPPKQMLNLFARWKMS